MEIHAVKIHIGFNKFISVKTVARGPNLATAHGHDIIHELLLQNII